MVMYIPDHGSSDPLKGKAHFDGHQVKATKDIGLTG